MQNITAEQVQKTLERKPNARVINVLPEENFRAKRIPGSVNVPLAKDDFVRSVERLAGSKEAEVIVYCASTDCDASPKAAKKLEAAGFTNVADFEAGVAGWEKAGLPLEGDKANGASRA